MPLSGEVEDRSEAQLDGLLGLGKLKDGAVNRTAGHRRKVIGKRQTHLDQGYVGFRIETQLLKSKTGRAVSHPTKPDQAHSLAFEIFRLPYRGRYIERVGKNTDGGSNDY